LNKERYRVLSIKRLPYPKKIRIYY
jgi:hypothetical protein